MKHFILAISMALAFAAAAPLRAAEGSTIAGTKAEYVKKAKAELDELSAKIDAMELKAKEAGASAKADMKVKLKALKARRKTASKDFAKLQRASGKAWAELKTGVDKGIEELKKAYDDAAKD